MDAPHAAQTTKSTKIPGYDYGSSNIARSPISTEECELIKQSAGFTTEDQRWLRAVGDVLVDQNEGSRREVAQCHGRPSISGETLAGPGW